MPKFSPGDKVSFINERLSGIVKQITGRGEVLVALDDGFEIPVDIRELVLVESISRTSEKTGPSEEKFATPRAELEEKIELGFALEGTTVKVYLLNNSPSLVLYLIYNTSGSPKLIGQGSLEKATSLFLTSFPLSDSEKWRQWRVQLLRYGTQKSEVVPVIDYSFKVRDASLVKETADIPFLGKKGYTIEIQAKSDVPDPVETGNLEKTTERAAVEPVEEIIDLHARDVSPADSIMAESILRSQLDLIRNCIEKAAAQGREQIIFIHGVGNGTLKMGMQKILMRHQDVKRWEEADTKKFGYGATAVYLKTS